MSFVKNPGTVVVLGGDRYVMPPLSLGVIEQFDEDKMAMLRGSDFSPARMRFLVDLLLESLRRNYPDMKRETVSMNIDIGNVGRLLMSILSVSGLTNDADDGREDAPGESSATSGAAGSTSSPTSPRTRVGRSRTSGKS